MLIIVEKNIFDSNEILMVRDTSDDKGKCVHMYFKNGKDVYINDLEINDFANYKVIDTSTSDKA